MNPEIRKDSLCGEHGHFATERLPWGYRERADVFKQDQRPEKLELTAGVIRDNDGKPVRLLSVEAAAASRAAKDEPHEYLPPAGLTAFREAITRILFGEAHASIAGRCCTVQTIGGAHALRLGGDFLSRLGLVPAILVSQDSWGDHRRIFERAGLAVHAYPYLHPGGTGIDFAALLAALEAAPAQSAVLVQACCHNPTGFDLSETQWNALLALMRKRGLLPFFDVAYLGLAKGLERDLWPLRAAVRQGLEFLVATACGKVFQLYDERVGSLTAITASPERAERVLSQLKAEIRASISSAPRHGASLIVAVVGDDTYFPHIPG
jgi:aromatic-amino-acid transaminase